MLKSSAFAPLDVEKAVRERYSAAAQSCAPSLCVPVAYDPADLAFLPAEILERDYGCGDPSRHVCEGETVLDLGSGGGKICFILSRRVGPSGRVIGVDRNDEMLALARRYQRQIGDRLGWHNTHFFKGSIQDLAIDLEKFDAYLQTNPVRSAQDWLRAESHAHQLRKTQPMIADASIDVIVSNCVLNLVEPRDRVQLFGEMFRVLKPGGRAVISDIVADQSVPEHLRRDPSLWSGCISGAFAESEFLGAFRQSGFCEPAFVDYQKEPWGIVEGIEFRSVTVRAEKPARETVDIARPPDTSITRLPAGGCCGGQG
jgi:ubiquinone/menaquinone biosynthesis C-methylase UbiE